MEVFRTFPRKQQSDMEVMFLRRRLCDFDLFELVKQTHPHLVVSISNDRHNAIEVSQGKSMIPSQKAKYVNYEVEHTAIVHSDYVEITFHGFCEHRLNQALRGYDALLSGAGDEEVAADGA